MFPLREKNRTFLLNAVLDLCLASLDEDSSQFITNVSLLMAKQKEEIKKSS